jgi:parallel beta-helix repeat protein
MRLSRIQSVEIASPPHTMTFSHDNEEYQMFVPDDSEMMDEYPVTMPPLVHGYGVPRSARFARYSGSVTGLNERNLSRFRRFIQDRMSAHFTRYDPMPSREFPVHPAALSGRDVHSANRTHSMRTLKLALSAAAVLCAGVALTPRSSMAQVFPTTANVPGPSAALSAAPPYTCVTNKYVDGTNGNDSNPGTAALPWKTIGNASNGWPNSTAPGECVNVLPGTYPISSTLIFAGSGATGNSNSPTGYVVYRSTVPGAAHIVAQNGINNGANGDMIMIWGGYVVIDGFEIDGNNQTANGAAIDGCAGGGGPYDIAHHMIIINNTIHNVGGSGVSSCATEYIIWRNNLVYNTTSTNNWQTSALNVWMPQSLAAGSYTPTTWDNTPYHIQIAYNIVHDNAEGPGIVPQQGCTPIPPATQGPPCYHTDGNGIIIDTTIGSSTCPTCGTPYPGSILVLGNVAYNNGGGGVHVFLSQNVTVANNTVYNNYLDVYNPGTARGELSNLGSSNITWVNNVAIATPGTGVLANNRPIISAPLGGGFQDSGIWTRNITFGASNISDSQSKVSTTSNLVSINPKLTSPPVANFVPLAGSPAIRTGTPQPYLASKTPNIGAY